MSRSSYLRGKFHEKLVKINENPCFIVMLKKFKFQLLQL